jgi:hypothetical protein
LELLTKRQCEVGVPSLFQLPQEGLDSHHVRFERDFVGTEQAGDELWSMLCEGFAGVEEFLQVGGGGLPQAFLEATGSELAPFSQRNHWRRLCQNWSQ